VQHSQCEVLLANFFHHFWKQELNQMMECLSFGTRGAWGWAYARCLKTSLFVNNQYVLCLCVNALFTCNFDHSFLLHPKVQMPPFFSLTTLIWMHSAYLSHFKFTEKQQVDQILKNLKNLMTSHNYTNCTLKNGKFSFIKQISIFFTKIFF
jgi:hypothetical protein